MTLATYGDLCIRPYMDNEIEPRAAITDDGPDGYTGADSWVKNQATLWAQSGHYVINEKFFASEDMTYWGTFVEIYYGAWAFQIPKWMNATVSTGRRYLYFALQTDPGATPHHTYRIRSADGSALLATGVRTSVDGEWVILFEVPLPASSVLTAPATWFEFLLSAEWDGVGSGLFDVTGAWGMVQRATAVDTDCNNPGVIDLIDPEQLAYGQPLDVYSTRALLATNEVLFASNVRPVVTMGWYDGGLDDLLDGALNGQPGIVLGEDYDENPYWEWLYFPRQGITRLRVGLNAIKNTDTRTLRIGFVGHSMEEVEVSSTTTGPAPGNWTVRGDLYVEIPPASGPLRFRIGLRADPPTSDYVQLLQLMVHEDVLNGIDFV